MANLTNVDFIPSMLLSQRDFSQEATNNAINFLNSSLNGKNIEQLNSQEIKTLSASLLKGAKDERYYYIRNCILTTIIAVPLLAVFSALILTPFYFYPSYLLLSSLGSCAIAALCYAVFKGIIGYCIFFSLTCHKQTQEALILLESSLKKDDEVVLKPTYDLGKTQEERDLNANRITTLVKYIASSGLAALGWNKGWLEERGREIEHLHPLKFLEFLISNPEMKECLKQLRSDSFKWPPFEDEFANRMNLQAQNDNLNGFLKDFAEKVNAPLVNVKNFCDSAQWHDLLMYLIDKA